MKDFFDAVTALFTSFPPVLIWILGPLFGSIVMLLITTSDADMGQPRLLIARFLAGWLTGTFLGPIVSPGVQAVIKAPTASLAFLSGLGGYYTAKRIIKNKQIELNENDHKPPGDGIQS